MASISHPSVDFKEISISSTFPVAREFTKVNLELTTACNLSCPDCSAATNNSGKRPVHHHPWGYFVEAARWLRGIRSLVVIGGEPTVHPQFADLVTRFRDLFQCQELILWTNGARVAKYANVISATFDAVYGSLYDERTAPWNPKPNTKAIDFIKIAFPNTATMEEPHVPMSRRGSGAICERGIHGPITYADGKIYGCCVAMGLPDGIGVTPSENWRNEVLQTPLPCGDCCFSPA